MSFLLSLAPFHGGAINLPSRPPSPLALTRVAAFSRPPSPDYSLLGFRVPFKVAPFDGPGVSIPLFSLLVLVESSCMELDLARPTLNAVAKQAGKQMHHGVARSIEA